MVDGELESFDMPFLEEFLLEKHHANDETTARSLAMALRRIVGNAPEADQPRRVLTFLEALMRGNAYPRSCFSQAMFGLFNDFGFEFDRAEEVNDFLWKILRCLPESMRRLTDVLFRLVQRHIVVMLMLYHDHRFCFGETRQPIKMRGEPMLETMLLWAQSNHRMPPCKYRRLLSHLARLGVPRDSAKKLVGPSGERLDALLRSLEDGAVNKLAMHRLIARSQEPTPTGDLVQAIFYAYPAIRLDDLWHLPRSPLFTDTHAWPPPVPPLAIPEPPMASPEPTVATIETPPPVALVAPEPVVPDTQLPTEVTTRLEAVTETEISEPRPEPPKEKEGDPFATRAPLPDINEEQGRASVASQLRRVVGRLNEATMGLAEISRALEHQAVEVGTSYRRAFTEHRELLDGLEGSWGGLNLAVRMHLATKPDASTAQREAFRSSARQIMDDKTTLESVGEKRSQAEHAVHEMHRAWLDARNRVQELRRKIGSVRAACQLFDLDPEPFEATIAIAEEACRRALEEVDTHKALVAIEPVNLPRVVVQTLALLPKVEKALEGLDRKGEQELAQLMLFAFLCTHSPRSHGRAPKTVAKMLTLGGLIEEVDAKRAQDALRAHYLDSFERTRWKARVIWRITKNGGALAERLLKARKDREAITQAVLEGRRIVNEQWLERRRQMAERPKKTDSETP